jgi:hypothetical protein
MEGVGEINKLNAYRILVRKLRFGDIGEIEG